MSLEFSQSQKLSMYNLHIYTEVAFHTKNINLSEAEYSSVYLSSVGDETLAKQVKGHRIQSVFKRSKPVICA